MGVRIPWLGDELLRYRAKYNLSQDELAERLKVTKQTIRNIEANKGGITPLTKTKVMMLLEQEAEREV